MSTEAKVSAASLEEVLFTGPAPDGGLYVPETIPTVELPSPRGSLVETSLAVARAFFSDDVPAKELEAIVSESLDFPIPLVPVEERVYALELFHGPTLAFKDVGARFMAGLMLYFLKRRKTEVTVLVATSGDTGSAVAHAFYRLDGVRVVVLFPRGKVSVLQQKLFTTLGENISAVAVEGNFDDCQRLVKQAFADAELVSRRPLVSANSINVGRLLPQTFYYFHILSQLPSEAGAGLVVATPSGNFGNLTAGLLAKRMGFPCQRFVAATNENDVVPEYLSTGTFRPRPSRTTLSNAMDVGNPSNFSRILWLYRNSLEKLRADLLGSVHADAETLRTMGDVHQKTGYLLDPHSAVSYLGALDGLRSVDADNTAVFLATAHPAKFQGTVERAIRGTIELPRELAQVAERTEHIVPIETHYHELREYLTE